MKSRGTSAGDGAIVPANDGRQFSLNPSRLSITYRLPLFIGTLLLGVIVIFTWVTYRTVKNAALESGRERLRLVTNQLASAFQQSAGVMAAKTGTAANDAAVKAFLAKPEATERAKLMTLLQPMLAPMDPSSLRVELRKADGGLVLALPDDSKPIEADLSTDYQQARHSQSLASIGEIRNINDTMTAPVVGWIKGADGQSAGYLIRWRKLTATPEARKTFLDLIGAESQLYVGNAQGDFWTDLVTTAPAPPFDVRHSTDVVEYSRDGKRSLLSMTQPIKGTPWYVTVEFTDTAILTQAHRFLRRMFIFGPLVLLAGLIGAVLLSRSFTKPLNSLTAAARGIAAGDYDHSVEVRSRDELGELATAFNGMALKVRDSQKNLENNVRQRTAQLEAANAELEAFSYSVSHDLRAPLRAMNGFSRILIENYGTQVPPEAVRYLNMIRDNATHMGRLIDDLLAFSQLGRKELQKQPIDSSGLVHRVFEELRPEAGDRKIQLTVGELPPVEADPALLRQVYVNLLSNAIKYTRGREEAHIEVNAKQNGGGPEDVIFVIKDDGAGFDMRYADKLFGVFQRLHRAEEFEGTGVGLATVQRIIQRHGGRIWAEAEVNRGATFYFTLQDGAPHDQ
jgi:signal transduction histidine kinase